MRPSAPEHYARSHLPFPCVNFAERSRSGRFKNADTRTYEMHGVVPSVQTALGVVCCLHFGRVVEDVRVLRLVLMPVAVRTWFVVQCMALGAAST